MKERVPQEVVWIIQKLNDKGFEAFLVGGCVRDIILKRTPCDWDITTNAVPEEIISIFEPTERKVLYENNFGTVAIINKELDKSDPAYAVEITPYRTEGTYTDNRRPNEVHFTQSLSEDLSRRDFTINAMAYDPLNEVFVDEFNGKAHLREKKIVTVGKAQERFNEDALRIMRAVRFAAQLGFSLDPQTITAIREQAESINNISHERVRDELIKLIDAPYAKEGIEMMERLGILQHVIPELCEGINCEQGGIHDYDVWEHNLRSLAHGTDKDYPFHVKIAALFHDIGKPRTRRPSRGRGTKKWTFYGHEVVGAKMVKNIMERLRFPKKMTKQVVILVRYHMFFSDPEAITLSAVRRMVRNVGTDLIWDLMDLRTCDRIGTGRPKEKPYRLRKYHAMIEEVIRDPISVAMLNIDGDIMVKEMGIKPGPRMGWILHALLQEVLDDPKKNTRSYLEKRVIELDKLDSNTLRDLGDEGKDARDKKESHVRKKIHRKHNVG